MIKNLFNIFGNTLVRLYDATSRYDNSCAGFAQTNTFWLAIFFIITVCNFYFYGLSLTAILYLVITVKLAHNFYRLRAFKFGGPPYLPGQRFKLIRLEKGTRIDYDYIYPAIAILALLILAGFGWGIVKGILKFVFQGFSGSILRWGFGRGYGIINFLYDIFIAIIPAGIVFVRAIILIYQVAEHDKIDDASLFELEELGFIKKCDIVTALYKDFYSWNDVKEGSKLLVLTIDSLLVFSFISKSNAKKYALQLSKIERMEIIKGLFAPPLHIDLNTILFSAKDHLITINIILEGMSFQDSPEEFIRQMLIDLDNILLNKPSSSPRITRTTPREATVIATTRHIEFEDFGALKAPKEVGNARIIDI